MITYSKHYIRHTKQSLPKLAHVSKRSTLPILFYSPKTRMGDFIWTSTHLLCYIDQLEKD